jgi:hypothetical protein
MKQVDPAHLAFKRQADPEGLLNPGKMIGWDNLGYDGMRRQSRAWPFYRTAGYGLA